MVVHHMVEVAAGIALEHMVEGRNSDGSCWQTWGQERVHVQGSIVVEVGDNFPQGHVTPRMEERCARDMVVRYIHRAPGASHDNHRGLRSALLVPGHDVILHAVDFAGHMELGVHSWDDLQTMLGVEEADRSRNSTW